METNDRRPSSLPRPAGTWFFPALVASVAGLGMVFLASRVRVPGVESGSLDSASSGPPSLVVARLDWLPAGGELRERLRLLDPTPLFMPGAGAGDALSGATAGVDRPGGSVTDTAGPVFLFSEAGPAKNVLRAPLPDSPLAAFEIAAAPRWFDGLARNADREGGAAASLAAGRLDVYVQGAAACLISVDIPSAPASEPEVWRPVELSVLVDAAGMVASPVVTTGSGVLEIDERVRATLKQDILPRLRLRPGAYRLVVGP